MFRQLTIAFALVVAFLASLALNWVGWWADKTGFGSDVTLSTVMTVGILCAVVLGTELAAFFAAESMVDAWKSREWLRSPLAAAVLTLCIAFNGWCGHHGFQQLFGESARPVSLDRVENRLADAQTTLSALETVELTSPDSVREAQLLLAREGRYIGVVDGVAGQGTTSALGEAVRDYRDQVEALTTELDQARQAERDARWDSVMHWVAAALLELLKAAGRLVFYGVRHKREDDDDAGRDREAEAEPAPGQEAAEPPAQGGNVIGLPTTMPSYPEFLRLQMAGREPLLPPGYGWVVEKPNEYRPDGRVYIRTLRRAAAG